MRSDKPNMPTCKAIGCSNGTGRAPSGVRFYSLPKDRQLAMLWLEKCGVQTDDAQVYKHAIVCSEHFTEDDIEEDYRYKLGYAKTYRPKVKEGVVPSIFKPNQTLAKPVRPRKPTVGRAKQKVSFCVCVQICVLFSSHF